jgi:hypothetical protein
VTQLFLSTVQFRSTYKSSYLEKIESLASNIDQNLKGFQRTKWLFLYPSKYLIQHQYSTYNRPSTLNCSHPLRSKPYKQYSSQEIVSHQNKICYEQTKCHNKKKEHMRWHLMMIGTCSINDVKEREGSSNRIPKGEWNRTFLALVRYKQSL